MSNIKTITLKGNVSFGFRQVLHFTEEQRASFDKDYAAAVEKDPKDRDNRDHMLVAGGGDFEKTLQIAVRYAFRGLLTDEFDPDACIGKGSIKVTFDEFKPSQS